MLFFLFKEPAYTHPPSGLDAAAITETPPQFGPWASFYLTWSVEMSHLNKMNKSAMQRSSSVESFRKSARTWFDHV